MFCLKKRSTYKIIYELCLYKIRSESNSWSSSGGKYNWVDHPEQLTSQMYSVPRFIDAYVCTQTHAHKHTHTRTNISTLQRIN